MGYGQAKHKVSFETAQLAFGEPHAISRPDRITAGEQRWHTLGLVGGIVIFLVVHTYYECGGEEVFRIISARKATSHERKMYGQGD